MGMLTAISAETVVLCVTNERMTLSALSKSLTDESSMDGTSNLRSRSVKNGAVKVAEAEAEADPGADLLVAREADRDLQNDDPDRVLVLDLAAVIEVVLVIVRETALDRETTSHESDRRIARILAHDRDQRAQRETPALDRVDDICQLLLHQITPAQFTPRLTVLS